MNQAAADIYQRFGLNFQSMKGKSLWELFPELKGTLVERELRYLIEEHRQVTYEFYYPKDQRWYETKGYPASPGAILVFRDITHKKNRLARNQSVSFRSSRHHSDQSETAVSPI